jgi:hypothetical protein
MDLKTDQQGNPILDQFSEEGFVDTVLRISNLAETESAYRFHLAASHKGDVVGLDVSVVKGIQGGFDSSMKLNAAHVYREGIRFYRSGPESDRLITALASLYGQGDKQLRMRDETRFTGIALHQGAIDIGRQPVKIKLFGHDQEADDKDYNESFFNLDLSNGFVFWNEKDQEYRQPLIRVLSFEVPKKP